MRQDHSQDTVDRTTVINWQPATVDSASNSVTYLVTSNLDLVDFDSTTASSEYYYMHMHMRYFT